MFTVSTDIKHVCIYLNISILVHLLSIYITDFGHKNNNLEVYVWLYFSQVKPFGTNCKAS